MALVDDLIANPGVYIGTGWFAPDERPPRVSRLVVTRLPGTCGVALDYEVMSTKGTYLHREHSILARSDGGASVLVIAHADAPHIVTMVELEDGFFAAPTDPPRNKGWMGVRIGLAEPGRIRHVYCWTDETGSFVETDVSEMNLVD